MSKKTHVSHFRPPTSPLPIFPHSLPAALQVDLGCLETGARPSQRPRIRWQTIGPSPVPASAAVVPPREFPFHAYPT